MKYCPRCGAKLDPGAKFCTKCGAKIPVSNNRSSGQKSSQDSSWIKAEQRSDKDRRQRTMVFKQQPNQKGNRQPRREPPKQDKNKRTNNILAGILIGLLIVAVALGGFFIWRNQQNNNQNRNQETTQSADGTLGAPEPGSANILEPSAATNEDTESARQDQYSGLVSDSGRTNYVTRGEYDPNFTGIATDDNGNRFFVVGGQVRYGFSGDVTDDGGNTYTIVNGQVVEDDGVTTTTNADDQGVDTTEYNVTDNSNGAQKFDDYALEEDMFINPNPPEMQEGEVSYGIDSIAYDEDGNFVVTFVIINGTDQKITVKGIDDIELRNGGGQTIATGKIDDIDPIDINAGDSMTLSTTLINESHENADLSNATMMATLVE